LLFNGFLNLQISFAIHLYFSFVAVIGFVVNVVVVVVVVDVVDGIVVVDDGIVDASVVTYFKNIKQFSWNSDQNWIDICNKIF